MFITEMGQFFYYKDEGFNKGYAGRLFKTSTHTWHSLIRFPRVIYRSSDE